MLFTLLLLYAVVFIHITCLKSRFSFNFRSERNKAQRRIFKELFAERNTNNGDAPKNSAAKSRKGDFPTENHYPKNVEECVAKADASVADILFKRCKDESGNFKTLNSGGNTYDGNAKEKSRKNPFEPKQKSSEYHPKDVSYCFHFINLSIKIQYTYNNAFNFLLLFSFGNSIS